MKLPVSKKEGFGSILIILFVLVLIVVLVIGFLFLFNKVSVLEKLNPLVKTDEKGVSLVYLKEVPYLKTGSEVCYEANLSCLGMSSTKIYDGNHKFFGFTTPTCDSQVIKEPTCNKYFDTDYAMDRAVYVRSPNAESTQALGADFFCLFSKQGKSGKFQYAYCVKKDL